MMLLSQLASVLTGPLLAYSLSVGDRGRYASVAGAIIVGTVFGSMGLPNAGAFFSARDNCPACIRRQLGVHSVCFGVVSGALAGAVLFFESGALQLTLLEISLAGGMTAVSIVNEAQRGLLRGVLKYRRLGAERLISVAVRAGSLVFVLSLGRLDLRVAISCGLGLPIVASSVVLSSGVARVRHVTHAHRESLPLLRFGARVWLGDIGGYVTSRLDQLIMAPLAGVDQLGLYAVAVSYSELPQVSLAIIRQILLPYQAVRSDVQRSSLVTRVAFSVSCVVLVPLVALSSIIVLPLMFGSPYRGAVQVTAVLAVGVPAWMAGGAISAVLEGLNRPGGASIANGVAAGATVVLLPGAVLAFGALGAALVTSLSSFVALGLLVRMLRATAGLSAREVLIMKFSEVPDVWHLIRRGRAA